MTKTGLAVSDLSHYGWVVHPSQKRLRLSQPEAFGICSPPWDEHTHMDASRVTAHAEWLTPSSECGESPPPHREVEMQATVQIAPDGTITANLDSDDYGDDDDSRALLTLAAEDMLDQCARVAIAAWIELHGEDDS